jgi:hypothetical protein
MITKNMLAFIEKNQANKVVFGERRTAEDKPVINKSDLDNCDRVLYRLDDGSQFTLTRSDVNSDPDFTPDWAF